MSDIRRYTDNEIADAHTRFRMAIKGQQVNVVEYVTASDHDAAIAQLTRERDALAAELAQERSDRQREHDLRVLLAGHADAFQARIAELRCPRGNKCGNAYHCADHDICAAEFERRIKSDSTKDSP
jgi:hypothetical protein